MKKRIIVLIFITLGVITSSIIYSCPNINDQIDVYISEIAVNDLTQEDITKLEKGIPVYGEGKLSAVLEDYE